MMAAIDERLADLNSEGYHGGQLDRLTLQAQFAACNAGNIDSPIPTLLMISTPLRMGANGLRSSCASVARNSSLRRSDSRSSSSLCLRSVISWVVPSNLSGL